MMSAVKILTPVELACSVASFVTTTSKAKMTANFFRPFSSIVLARMTSRLCTGPMLIPETGILTASERRNSNRASRDPKVEACTQTPSPAHSPQPGVTTCGLSHASKPLQVYITCLSGVLRVSGLFHDADPCNIVCMDPCKLLHSTYALMHTRKDKIFNTVQPAFLQS